MDKEIRDKWCQALRSGKYSQATGYLCDGTSFCCLGVLCEVNNEKRTLSDIRDLDKDIPLYSYYIKNTECEYDIPEGYCDLNQETIEKLVELNDDEECSFDEIADYIERNL